MNLPTDDTPVLKVKANDVQLTVEVEHTPFGLDRSIRLDVNLGGGNHQMVRKIRQVWVNSDGNIEFSTAFKDPR